MERKLHKISGSLVVNISKQICELYGFKNGNKISLEPICVYEFTPKKNNAII